MRRAPRIDDNQPAMVAQLRDQGYLVASTAAAGGGFPDLVVGRGGVIKLVEVKDPAKPPSARKLTPLQVDFHNVWAGHVAMCLTAAEVVALFEEDG